MPEDEKTNGEDSDLLETEPRKALLVVTDSPFGKMSRVKSGKERDGGLPGEEGIGGNLRINVPRFSMLDVESPVSHSAQLQIEYTPREKIISAENVAAYIREFETWIGLPEDAVELICRHMAEALMPMMLQVSSNFTERDGVSINPQARFVHPELIRAQQGGGQIQTLPGARMQ